MRKRKSVCRSTLLCIGLARGRSSVEGVEKRCEKAGLHPEQGTELAVPAEQCHHRGKGDREAPHIPVRGTDGMGTR